MFESPNKNGQQIVLWLAACSFCLSLLVIVVNNLVVDSENIIQQLFRLAIMIALGIALYAGANWARWIWIVLYTLGGLIALFGGIFFLASAPLVGVLMIVMGIVYISASALLLFMPDVKEHFGIWDY